MSDFSVHDQPDFVRVYDEDDLLQVRRGDLRALLDLATGSLDFSSGFWDNEQTEVARAIAKVLGIDAADVTPSNFLKTYEGSRIVTLAKEDYLRIWEEERNAYLAEPGGAPVHDRIINRLRVMYPERNVYTYTVDYQS